MDLVATLRKKADTLEGGEYTPGLKAVLRHIETAFRHLSRGQDSGDETAFTDAIYRTNQAFEGSVKEAYRVLAAQDPERKTPFEIETYLEKNNVFRPRVLSQLTTYRTEWRNPSTHNYKLDFDESEALLAIVSVSAFACLLFDQISEQLAYRRSLAEADAQKQTLKAALHQPANAALLARATELLSQFCLQHLPVHPQPVKQTEIQFIGALHGFLASAAPDLVVTPDAQLVPDQSYRADLLLSKGQDKLVVEVKTPLFKVSRSNAIAQLETYMALSGITSGILLLLPGAPTPMARQDHQASGGRGQLVILSAANARGA